MAPKSRDSMEIDSKESELESLQARVAELTDEIAVAKESKQERKQEQEHKLAWAVSAARSAMDDDKREREDARRSRAKAESAFQAAEQGLKVAAAREDAAKEALAESSEKYAVAKKALSDFQAGVSSPVVSDEQDVVIVRPPQDLVIRAGDSRCQGFPPGADVEYFVMLKPTGERLVLYSRQQVALALGGVSGGTVAGLFKDGNNYYHYGTRSKMNKQVQIWRLLMPL
mmetsp:Transcript_1722/g.5184  ORF Transcript_1722/g.5184 Transcript_1722/m.5184 type:complete len:228 (+) Transcript_1722:137-820(+)|eukprot:CAMPEP_0119272904 /NCGR_PEP_ID=MMETSP1329-20130426/9143_1 /TAXON_ID=114041 /ORGANISM="Genus nov. species nov., Strain RCC1024" /LENGTH=227 /DNA_ID=CAMNT_0007273019 /DNA_START=116 /DNA_END=799 /DNA_ORIENTATION=+